MCVEQDRCVEEAREALNTFDLFVAEDEEPQWEPTSVTKNGREVSLAVRRQRRVGTNKKWRGRPRAKCATGDDRSVG
eukprot:1188812-Prorocentrum_minimum.AAC.1